jgi:hypothetical protein
MAVYSNMRGARVPLDRVLSPLGVDLRRAEVSAIDVRRLGLGRLRLDSSGARRRFESGSQGGELVAGERL